MRSSCGSEKNTLPYLQMFENLVIDHSHPTTPKCHPLWSPQSNGYQESSGRYPEYNPLQSQPAKIWTMYANAKDYGYANKNAKDESFNTTSMPWMWKNVNIDIERNVALNMWFLLYGSSICYIWVLILERRPMKVGKIGVIGHWVVWVGVVRWEVGRVVVHGRLGQALLDFDCIGDGPKLVHGDWLPVVLFWWALNLRWFVPLHLLQLDLLLDEFVGSFKLFFILDQQFLE